MIRPSSELALGAAGYRLTGPRRAVADLIAARDGYFTAADLLADARARRLGIGRATVFRALEVLVELGAVERIDLPSIAPGLRVTISLGVHVVKEHDINAAIAAADALLYRAKELGRNRVEMEA